MFLVGGGWGRVEGSRRAGSPPVCRPTCLPAYGGGVGGAGAGEAWGRRGWGGGAKGSV